MVDSCWGQCWACTHSSLFFPPLSHLPSSSLPLSFPAAVALAISRDGSSGGVIRIATIDESGIERKVFTGSDIPTFFDSEAPAAGLEARARLPEGR